MKGAGKVLLLGGVFLLCGAATVASGEPANLAPNHSFEDGAEMPAEWSTYAYPGATFRRDAEVARTGKASARIDLAAGPAERWPAYRMVVHNALPGEEYAGRVWARTRGEAALVGYIAVEFYQGDTRISFQHGQYTDGGERDWKELVVRAMVPEGADSVRFAVLCAHGVGTVWYDDASFTRTAEAPAPLQGDSVKLRLDTGRVLCPRLHGFGAQGDFQLTRSFNTSRGVTEADRKLVLDRVRAMRPHLIRTFFDYKWWEPEEGKQMPDSEAMRDYLLWVRALKRMGTSVLLNPWGDCFAYSDWMRPEGSRLPAPEKREAMVRSLVGLVEFLRHKQRLDNVRYVCLINEPDNDFTRRIPVDEYVRLNRLLDRLLRERGLRDEVSLLGADESSGDPYEPSDWYRQVVAQGVDYCDGMAVHTYRHQEVYPLATWVRKRIDLLAQADPGRPARPLLITEFGYGGETYKNWENHKYEYGLFLADFAITALREGASAALMWCLFDTYYSQNDAHQQQYGLWRYRDKGWEPRPGFYSWSLVTRYTRPGSRVVAVEAERDVRQVRAVALLSPKGKLTVMAVNRHRLPLKVSLASDLRRPASLRFYAYTRESIPMPGGKMIGPSGTVRLRPGAPAAFELPAESFVLLTNVR